MLFKSESIAHFDWLKTRQAWLQTLQPGSQLCSLAHRPCLSHFKRRSLPFELWQATQTNWLTACHSSLTSVCVANANAIDAAALSATALWNEELVSNAAHQILSE